MGILLLCIFCNVILAVIFKYFSAYRVDNLNAIITNYIVCVLTASVVLGTFSVPLDLFQKPWWIYSFMLAVLFIVGFNIMALSFQKSGVALTVIIQKMSLIVPASFAIAFYNESFGLYKGMGILLALVAVVLVNIPSKDDEEQFSLMNKLILYPLITFVLSGIIEVILYYVEVANLVGDEGIMFTASSFGQAAVLGACYSIYRMFKQGIKPGLKELVGGIVLGVPNFMSIYLLVYLLSKGWQGSILFPTNSIGILLLTALIGFIFYREKASMLKIAGMILGVLAIVFLSFAV